MPPLAAQDSTAGGVASGSTPSPRAPTWGITPRRPSVWYGISGARRRACRTGRRRRGRPARRSSRPRSGRARARRTTPCRPARADAPASTSSIASQPATTPPAPTIGSSGSAACTSKIVRTATGGSPCPTGPRRPRRAPAVAWSSDRCTMPSSVLTSVTASAPRRARRRRPRPPRSVFGLSFAQRGTPATAASRRSPRRSARGRGRRCRGAPRGWGTTG